MQFVHDGAGSIGRLAGFVDAHHDAIGTLKIDDSGAFLEKFRVGDDFEGVIRFLPNFFLDLFRRADRNGRFVGHDEEPVHGFPDGAGRGKYEA